MARFQVLAGAGVEDHRIQRAREATCRLGLRAIAPPDGAFYVFANVEAFIGKRSAVGTPIESDSDLVAYLLRDHVLATVGGAAYGMSPYVRLSFASSLEIIEEGCRRLKKACETLR